MKIAVVGCGAVGSYYGARLARGGDEAHFLLRSDYDSVKRQGVLVRSPEGDFQVWPQCARRPEEIGPADLVLIGLKTTANDAFARLLPPLVGPGTVLLTLQNGLGNEEDLARLFPAAHIMAGLCFVGLNRIAPGVIQHIAYGQIDLGEFQRPPELLRRDREHPTGLPSGREFASSGASDLASAMGGSAVAGRGGADIQALRPSRALRDLAARFCAAGVPCIVSDNLGRSHWEKLVWNIPFNGLGVAGVAGFDALAQPCCAPQISTARDCLTTDQLLADARWYQLVRDLMQEVIAAARALRFDVPDAFADKLIERTRTIGAYRASTLIDFELAHPLEMQHLFLEPLRRATQAGAIMPLLSALCQVLKRLDRGARPAA